MTKDKKQLGIKVVVSEELASAVRDLPRCINVSAYIRKCLQALVTKHGKVSRRPSGEV